MGSKAEVIEARFWRQVRKTASCWLWEASRTAYGYGRFVLPGPHYTRAHRVAWLLTNGPIPDGLWVLHNCPGGDNPACVNPAHLWLGTHRQNMADMRAKGRSAMGDKNGMRKHPERHVRGEACPRSRLSEADVRQVRALLRQGWTQDRVAVRLGMGQASVWRIHHRVDWAHVPDEEEAP